MAQSGCILLNRKTKAVQSQSRHPLRLCPMMARVRITTAELKDLLAKNRPSY